MNAPAFTLRATLAGCPCRSAPFAPELAFGGGELAEEVLIRAAALSLRATLAGSLSRSARLIDPADGVLLLVLDGVDVVDGIDEGGELAAIEPEAGEVVVGQGVLERGIALLDGGEGGVDLDGDVALLGLLLDVGPAGGLGQVEDILHGVELMSAAALTLRATLAGCPCRSAPFNHVEVVLLALGHELGPAFFKFIRDELEKDQREDDVVDGRLRVRPSGCLWQSVSLRSAVLMSAPALTLRATLKGCLCRSAPIRRLDRATELVGGVPERFFEGFLLLGGGFLGGFLFGGHGYGGS